MHHTLIWIIFVFLNSSCLYGVPIEWDKELDYISSKLKEISSKVMDAVEKINMKIDVLSEKVDGISREMESQKSTVEDMKKSFEDFSGTKEEISELMKKIESYGQKQLKDQQTTRNILNSQKTELEKIKTLTVTGFTKSFEKLSAISSGEIQLLSGISKDIGNLTTVYTRQEVKLITIENTLKEATDSVSRTKHNNDNELKQLWKNISVTLNEQNKPLSPGAVSHVNRADSITNIVINEMNGLKDLEPKLIHVVRLSEDIQKEITGNDLSPIANNLTNSLKAIEASTPLALSKVFKEVNNLKGVLLSLKSMSKHNDCFVDLTPEIRDHHDKIIKYLNETRVSSNVDQSTEDEKWNAVMKKLQNIERSSDSNVNIYDRLTKLREDIGNVRKSLQDYLGESDPDEDVVFG